MRKSMLLVALLAAGPSSAAPDPAAMARVEKELKQIDSSLKSYRKHSVELEGFSTMGGELKLYLEKGKLRRASIKHGGEMGNSAEEYSFKDGALIHHTRKETEYKWPITETPESMIREGQDPKEIGKVQRVTADSFTFDGKTLVRFVRNGKEIAPTNPRFRKQQQRVLKEAAEWLAVVKKCQSKKPGSMCRSCSCEMGKSDCTAITCE